MRGLAAELSGAKLWMKVATARFVELSGMKPNTCSAEKELVLDGDFLFSLFQLVAEAN